MDCSHCRVTFESKAKLNSHLKTKKCIEWRGIGFKCSVCKGTFWAYDELREHLRCSPSIKGSVDGGACGTCNIAFKTVGKLKAHLKTKKCLSFRTIRCLCERCGGDYACGDATTHACNAPRRCSLGVPKDLVEFMDEFTDAPSGKLMATVKTLFEQHHQLVVDTVKVNVGSWVSTAFNGVLEGEGRLLFLFMAAKDFADVFRLLYGSNMPVFVMEGVTYHITKVHRGAIHCEKILSFAGHFYDLYRTVLQFMARIWLSPETSLREEPLVQHLLKMLTAPREELMGTLREGEVPKGEIVVDPPQLTFTPFGTIIKEVAPGRVDVLKPLIELMDVDNYIG